MTSFADRLDAAVRNRGVSACVGFDPLLERLPEPLLAARGIHPDASEQPDRGAAADALHEFGLGVIGAIADLVPAIKLNIAFFERFQQDGIAVYRKLVTAAQQAGLVVIGDIKRADIGHSSAQYAAAQLSSAGGPGAPDAVTVNPYFGIDGIRPFLEVARDEGRGVFALVQTSNESAVQVQDVMLANGSTLADHVAKLVDEWSRGDGLIGTCGYSAVGAVVSPRDLSSTDRVRSLMPHSVFLVPGFGAQGRTVEEVRRCFNPDGLGAIVTASRSVIYAFDRESDHWRNAVAAACRTLVSDIRSITS